MIGEYFYYHTALVVPHCVTSQLAIFCIPVSDIFLTTLTPKVRNNILTFTRAGGATTAAPAIAVAIFSDQ